VNPIKVGAAARGLRPRFAVRAPVGKAGEMGKALDVASAAAVQGG
jgi:hypothetical protein